MLTGSDLLNKVKELGDVSKSDLVRACGYVSGKKDGGERLNFTAFYEALLEAKGVNLGIGGGAGRDLCSGIVFVLKYQEHSRKSEFVNWKLMIKFIDKNTQLFKIFGFQSL